VIHQRLFSISSGEVAVVGGDDPFLSFWILSSGEAAARRGMVVAKIKKIA